MKKYKISIHFEREVDAEDEAMAISMFEDEMALANDSIENYIEVKEVEE